MLMAQANELRIVTDWRAKCTQRDSLSNAVYGQADGLDAFSRLPFLWERFSNRLLNS